MDDEKYLALVDSFGEQVADYLVSLHNAITERNDSNKQSRNVKCLWCGARYHDDGRGCCNACGAPEIITEGDVEFIKSPPELQDQMQVDEDPYFTAGGQSSFFDYGQSSFAMEEPCWPERDASFLEKAWNNMLDNMRRWSDGL